MESYYARHREHALEYQRQYRLTHKEQIRKYRAKWMVMTAERRKKRYREDAVKNAYHRHSALYNYHRRKLLATDIDDPKFAYYHRKKLENYKLYIQAREELKRRKYER